MANRIYINGTDYTKNVSGLKEVSESITLNAADNTVSRSFSVGELVFKNDAFELLRDTFFTGNLNDDCGGILEGEIHLDCLSEIIGFVIEAESISEFLPAVCEARASIEIDPNYSVWKCLNSSVWWRNGFLDAVDAGTADLPKVPYAKHRPLISSIMLIIWYIFSPIINAIILIVNVVDAIPGVNISLDDDLEEFAQSFRDFVGGLGRFHVAPKYTDLLDFHCARCGITWQSSILTDEKYLNLAFLNADSDHGVDMDSTENYNDGNLYLLTMGEILEIPKDVFNWDYRINAAGVLVIEHSSYFHDNVFIMGDVDEIYTDGNAENAPSYNYVSANLPFWAEYQYANDQIEEAGNRLRKFDYGKFVSDFDTLNGDCQEGSYSIEVPAGMASFMKDRAQGSFFEKALDNFRANAGDFGAGDHARSRALLLKSGTAILPKLILLEDTNDGYFTASRRAHPGDGDLFQYNYNLYWEELMSDFHYNDDPSNAAYKRFAFAAVTEFVYAPENFQEVVDNIHLNGLNIGYNTFLGVATPNPEGGEITIDYSKGTITLSNFLI